LIEQWIENLAERDPDLGMPLCPFAKPAWDEGRVRVVETSSGDKLWSAVLKSVALVNSGCDVVLVVAADYEGTYADLEEATDRLNDFFFAARLDLWALSHLDGEAVIFLQKLTHLDNSAAKLEKLGYYNHYSPCEYERLIAKRRQRRDHYARNEEDDARL